MEEDIVIITPEPSPDPAPAPEPTPPAEPSDPVIVVSVDELIDWLVQNTQDEEETVESVEAAEAVLEDPGDVGVDDVVPGLIGDAVDILLGIRNGMKNVESIEQVVNHPALTTPFQDYTVTEALLLFLLLFFFLKACMDMIRRAFSWLL